MDILGEFFNRSAANDTIFLTSFSNKVPKSGFTMLMEKFTHDLHIFIFKPENLETQWSLNIENTTLDSVIAWGIVFLSFLSISSRDWIVDTTRECKRVCCKAGGIFENFSELDAKSGCCFEMMNRRTSTKPFDFACSRIPKNCSEDLTITSSITSSSWSERPM